jgi:hypothetical protein
MILTFTLLPLILKLQPSLAFRDSYVTISKIHGGATRIKIRHSDCSVDWNIKIARQLEQVFGPHRMKLKVLEEIKHQLPSQCVSTKQKNTKKYFFFLGDSQLFAYFRFSWGILDCSALRNARKECNVSLISSLHCLVRSNWSHNIEKLNSKTLSLFAARYDSFNRNSF